MEINNKARLSSSSKNKHKKAWYKEQADILDANHSDLRMNYHGVSEYKRMKVNYDLFNNVLDLSDFEYFTPLFYDSYFNGTFDGTHGTASAH